LSAFAKLSGFVLVLASCAACGGEPFQAGSGGVANHGASAGDGGLGAASGGSFNAGGGTTSEGGRSGSSSESGGAGSTTATGGTGSGANFVFPKTALLDDFDREDGAPGQSWIGALDRFEIDEQTLVDKGSSGAPLVWKEAFGADQEVFATLHDFDAEQAEINLLMKVQDPFSGCDLMEVLYEPAQGEVEVQFCHGNVWIYAGTAGFALRPGDVLGARSYSDGTTKVYVNGEVVLTVDASTFQYHAVGGQIGVNSLGDSYYDDFGGGDIAP
jgi:hypothetical protein